jgi:hypothetical protein
MFRLILGNWGTNNEDKFAKTTCSKKILERA